MTPPIPMQKNCNIFFWIRNDPPPPSELFQKFMDFGRDGLPLKRADIPAFAAQMYTIVTGVGFVGTRLKTNC